MLGIADLHTPEAVAAAESAIAGYQPIIPLAGDSSRGSESEDSSDDDDDDDDDDDNVEDNKEEHSAKFSSEANEKDSSKASRNQKSRKRPNIVELS